MSYLLIVLLPAALAGGQTSSTESFATRAQQEQFLLTASIVRHQRAGVRAPSSRRVELEDGQRTHAASIQLLLEGDGKRNYRLNVAAYELDKMLSLDFVPPSVERAIDGVPAVVTWWLENVRMSEMDRRRQELDPPDMVLWNAQLAVVRVFDELLANAYRKIDQELYRSTVWDNLLITTEWRIWLVDHTRTFGATRRLEHPESLTRCDRTVLDRLRALNKSMLQRRLGRFLTVKQVDALEHRRALIVKHFDEEIGRKGEQAVIYDLPRR